MSDMRTMIEDTSRRLFGDKVDRTLLEAAAAGKWPDDLWDATLDTGLTTPVVPESEGGAGLNWREVYPVVWAAGRYCAPIPIVESIIASNLIALVGIPIPDGALSVHPGDPTDRLELVRDGSGWRLSGTARGVPWGGTVGHVVLTAEHESESYRVLAPIAGCQVTPGLNIAGEPRDGITFDSIQVEAESIDGKPAIGCPRALGAMARTAQLAGAFEGILQETIRYVNERKQFGRPLAKFQVVQQNLAVLAEDVAATGVAAEAAFVTADRGDAKFEIATAKVRACAAIGPVTSTAHQLLGAMGFTREHHLQFLTRRAWAWRGEFGGEREWAALLGRRVLEAGDDGVWPLLTGD